ncbi:MAG: hypothetical protein DRJ62_03440 [Thermoprotei archaeon]|nr:MAG: hypothetical protein DRJ62_03440 [Thermoprotei archaeon]
MELLELKITVLVDNKPNPDSSLSLKTAHGLSLLLELLYEKDRRALILFDTGPSPEVLESNAKALGVELEKVDVIAVSHGHYDHTGGFPAALEGSRKLVVMHPRAFETKVRIKPCLKYIGVPYTRLQLELMGASITGQPPLQLAEGVYVHDTRGIRNRRVDGNLGVLSEDGVVKVDEMWDELLLRVELDDVNMVLTGCAHPGIDRIVEYLSGLVEASNRPLKVLGGFHLAWSSLSEAKRVALRLKELGVEEVYPGHCTGDVGIRALREVYGDRCKPLYTGFTLTLR